MIVINQENQEIYTAQIKTVRAKDLKQIHCEKQFSFDWELEKANQLFKLVLKDTNTILGLMSLIDYPSELRIEIHLLELSEAHKGKEKKIGRIAGYLIAYACKLAFKKGYGSFVSLVPKTRLIKHYQEAYGFLQFGRQLALLDESSKKLIEKYL
ncbi:MAG: GNAT family N-acetyltransferase [Saprospiraceae bacterium]